jgi:hypothetical protein
LWWHICYIYLFILVKSICGACISESYIFWTPRISNIFMQYYTVQKLVNHFSLLILNDLLESLFFYNNLRSIHLFSSLFFSWAVKDAFKDCLEILSFSFFNEGWILQLAGGTITDNYSINYHFFNRYLCSSCCNQDLETIANQISLWLEFCWKLKPMICILKSKFCAIIFYWHCFVYYRKAADDPNSWASSQASWEDQEAGTTVKCFKCGPFKGKRWQEEKVTTVYCFLCS